MSATVNTEATELIDASLHERRVKFGEPAAIDFPALARNGSDGVADGVVAAYAPYSPAVEPLRSLRSQLMLRWLHATSRRMLAVTSPGRLEGRSWVAANLATVFAQTGQPTLLIDADLRQPSQHRLFNLENLVGLSSLLAARTPVRDAFVRVHPELQLFVLPAGPASPNPQELLLSPMFETVLDRLGQLFSIVVVDTPAASSSADAQIIAARAGAALLVSRRHRTRASGLLQTTRCLMDSGVHVLGSVVNEH